MRREVDNRWKNVRRRGGRWCAVEGLEGRWLMTVPVVTGINRSNPVAAVTGAGSVSYAVAFNTAVNGVDAGDFKVVTGGGVAAGTVGVTGSGNAYTVTVNGVRGTGDLRLDLIDNDSIVSQNTNSQLGGPGVANGSFEGQGYQIVQTGPRVVSIHRVTAAGPTTGYAVTFSEPVTGVDAADFVTVRTGTLSVGSVQVSGSGAAYTVTLGGITGSGTVGLNLVDNGSIRDADGNPLSGSSVALAPQATYGAGQNPRSVVVADVNGDGRPDLIVSNTYYSPYANCVSVLLGNGGGTFGNPGTFAITTPYALTTADLNGDGRVDLVATSRSGVVSELLGNGNGTFQNATALTGVTGAFVTSADVNGDGKGDVIVTDGASVVSVLLGSGDGNFKTPATFSTGSYNRGVTAVDVNGDGKTDLAVANFFNGAGGNSVSVLLGNGNGTFSGQATFATGLSPVSVAAADFNGDGKMDLAVADQRGHAMSILIGNGNGTFAAQSTYLATRPAWVTTADVNGDGNVDVVYCDYSTNSVGVMLGNGDGTFATRVLAGVGATPKGVAVAELDGDGKVDVITANYAGGSTSVLLGVFNGGFTGDVTTVNASATITGTAGADAITLVQDAGHGAIDWVMGTASGYMGINEVGGLTINGGGGNDVITLDYTNGSPLPVGVHLNGTFTVNGLAGANPFARTTVEIAQSTVYFSYAGSSVAGVVRAALAAGYNGGAWNGSGAGASGAIVSGAAGSGPAGVFGVGYADSADGVVLGQPVNMLEVRYTVMGDANLDGVVDSSDAIIVGRNFLVAGRNAWDQGNFNYDSVVDFNDAQVMQKNYGTQISASVVGATAEAVNAGAGESTPLSTDDTLDVGIGKGSGRKQKKHGKNV